MEETYNSAYVFKYGIENAIAKAGVENVSLPCHLPWTGSGPPNLAASHGTAPEAG